MKCKECGTECRWLYYPNTKFPRDYYDADFIQTDLWFCPDCETVYRQWIEPIIHRDEVKINSLNGTKIKEEQK